MTPNQVKPVTSQHPEKHNTRRANIIMWMLILVMPLTLIFIMEQIGFTPHPTDDPRVCQRPLTPDATARITVKPLVVGQIPHETQRFEVVTPASEGEWQILSDMTLNLPDITPNCDDNIGMTPEWWWLWHGKIVLVSADEGRTWHGWGICDEPRPGFGCVRDEHIQAVRWHDDALVVDIFAREGNYQVRTTDAGVTWTMPDDDA